MSLITWLLQLCTDNMLQVTVTADYSILFLVPNLSYHQSGIFCSLGTYGIVLVLFTALHGMQTRSYDESSVRLSVKRVHCDKTNERYV